MSRRFNDQYRELVSLRDGTRAEMRLIRPDDKELLVEGFEHTSAESRYLRFFVPKTSLSESELRYLTEIDGENHLAIGAIAVGDDGREHGLGVARFVRLAGDPTVAEAAFIVVDSMQGKGLGTLLFRRIMAAARERDIETFRCYVLADNRHMADVIRVVAPNAAEHVEDGVATFDVSLSRPAP